MTYATKPLVCDPARIKGISGRQIVNHYENNFRCHTLAGGTPILALDMYEHSYHLDYGAKAADYVGAFMAAINWPAVGRELNVLAPVLMSSGFLASAAVRAQDHFKILSESEIRATVVGKDITDGSHWSIYVRPGGALVGAESGSGWTGTWNIQKSKLCMSNPGSKAFDCYEVWMSGQGISLRLKKDDDSFVGVIERHKGN